MEKALLSVHVLAAIVFVGGSAVATSLFPRYAPVAAPAGTAAGDSGERDRAVAVLLHRVSRGYGIAGLVVPAAGIVLGVVQGRMGELWLNVSMVLTIVAGGLLALLICPRQREALATPGSAERLRSLSMLAGIYNLLWAIVVVLMIARPEAGT
ncbi:hypothetical protein [Nonomuraea jiangxiensis]|uniref:Integral membrane protein n=1 Tax=Nonomuraea jiangxiensis TaxID=633440 RepID=A0A1G8W3P1_9ACTN|nr:hypothetical protein [Nonomuraea jiangxiensis]SDJ72991.1 hypothetical protein SAMN05421869_11242 [Nonomuraea jiangxiensis]